MSNKRLEIYGPIVSIGMFVYNGDNSIREAIDSILNQTFRNYELIISDNASTDNTEVICREYEKKDGRIRYIRQSKNLGPSANCLFVFDEAQGEYFMWAAHDDIRSKDFLEINLNFLRENPDYVASTSPVTFDDSKPDPIKMGDKSLDDESAEARFLLCLATFNGNGRFYSLMKRSIIQQSKIIRNATFFGADNAFILESALKGKFKRLEQGYVILGRHGMSGSGNIYAAFRNGLLDWIIPMNKLSIFILRQSSQFSIKGKLIVSWVIFKINLISFSHQIKTEIKKRFLVRK